MAEATGIRRYPGSTEDIPAEVIALGQAESLHPPSLECIAGIEDAQTHVLIGLPIVLFAIVVLAVLKPSGLGFPALLLVALGGGLFAAAPLLINRSQRPTFLIYREAFVVLQHGEFVVIPWDDIRELNHGRNVVASDGNTYHLDGFAKNLGGLYQAVHDQVMARLLPPALATIAEGGTVTFGELTIGANEIAANGETLPWSDVSSLVISGPSVRKLTIRSQHKILAFGAVDLNTTPNDVVMLEVVRRVCPPHLLVAKQG